MPLEVLGPLVVVGIGAIVLLVHLFGYSRSCVLPDRETVEAHWLRHFPEDTVKAVAIDDDGGTAFVAASGGDGIVWSFGADTVARRLAGADVEEVDEGFRVTFHDFAAPRHLIRLTRDHHAQWAERLTTGSAE